MRRTQHVVSPDRIIYRAVTGGFITAAEADSQVVHDHALWTAERLDSEWPEGEGFGSSDMTFVLQEFLESLGIKTAFVNGRLTAVRSNPHGKPDPCLHPEKTARPQTPQLHKKLAAKGVWHRGDVNADIGGGPFEFATDFLTSEGVTNLVWDTFNRSKAHNEAAMRKITRGVDSVTIANVLNVIRDKGERIKLLHFAASVLKPHGVVYVWIHEGDAENRGHPDKCQNNMPTAWYVPEIQTVFREVERRGRIIAARM